MGSSAITEAIISWLENKTGVSRTLLFYMLSYTWNFKHAFLLFCSLYTRTLFLKHRPKVKVSKQYFMSFNALQHSHTLNLTSGLTDYTRYLFITQQVQLKFLLAVFGFCSKRHAIPRNLSPLPISLFNSLFLEYGLFSLWSRPRSFDRDQPGWIKRFNDFLWLKCQNYGSIQVPLLSKDFSVWLGRPARTERRVGTLGK